METARAARGGRRQNLSLRRLAPGKSGRDQAGTDRAFESFYREHVAEVYQYALAVLTNPADAEDVTQQTFLNAYRAFQKGERPRTPHNWLIKIAHNVCRMRWRQSSRRPQEIPLENAPEPAAGDDEKPSLDEVLVALARLPFNQRAAIVMREVEDRSYAEIADVLNTTVPAVEALLFRARTNLRSRRKSLGVLTLAPLPGSLTSFFGGGGSSLLAVGGAALGSEALLKAAAIVVSGVVAGGLGFKAVKAVATPQPSGRLATQRFRHHLDPSAANPLGQFAPAAGRANTRSLALFGHPRRRAGRGGALRAAPTNDIRGAAGAAPAVTAAPGSSGGSAAAPAAATTGAGAVSRAAGTVAQTGSTAAKAVPTLPVSTPPAPVPVPPPPPLPTVSVPVPTPTLPTVPAVTTVPTVPALPPPPRLK